MCFNALYNFIYELQLSHIFIRKYGIVQKNGFALNKITGLFYMISYANFFLRRSLNKQNKYQYAMAADKKS
jgi:hypothetical protein